MQRFDNQHGLCTHAGISLYHFSALQSAFSIYLAMFLSQALAKAEGWVSTVYTSQQEVRCPCCGPAISHVRALLPAGCTIIVSGYMGSCRAGSSWLPCLPHVPTVHQAR